MNATLHLVVDKQLRARATDTNLGVDQRSIDFLALCMDVDTMRMMKLIAEPLFQPGIELLEGIVAMLTKMT